MRGLRRRWPTGVAIVTVRTSEGLRGVTVSSLLLLSVEPPLLAIALEADAEFQSLLPVGARFGISLLERSQEFLAERFAGRAPVPDSAFTGVPHRMHESGVPLIAGSIGFAVAKVRQRIETGDHLLLTGEAIDVELPPDSDDPMLVYDGRYRGLEIS
jgi:flavin reductase (DIM6/NTAB) family NADH-FMN oxidoreductase RutF